ncbi:hypothetical protein Gotri_011220 [Gossypium trilobum]|uniref:MADS-box domain-containing protein n=1 Tax=Gossypium trilobum TaxID=34281 RepID=A0A7J9ET13_9ROSI|nr:hypothetical protein [Gossypium trilobum]
MANTGKKTKGKQNIEIKMIENDDDRLITFSNRRLGIYKKIETPLDQLSPRELYEQYSHFSKLLDLFHISQSKKIATASSMLARTGPAEDAPTNFPLG